MNSKPRYKGFFLILAAFTALGLFLSSSFAAAADDRVYHYESINVDIQILKNSDIQVTEIQTFVFTSGDFHYAFRWIPTDRLESIDNVEVWEGARQYQLNPLVREWIDIRKETGESPGGDNYAYATWKEKGKFWIGWWFPETVNSSRTIELRYTVHGALRINSPADELYWKAIFSDRDSYVASSKVTVHLPEPVPPQQLVVYSRGVPTIKQAADDQTVEFFTGKIPVDEELEIEIYFPHGIVSGVPQAWQTKLEKKEKYNNEVKPIINLVLTLFGLIGVPILGALWIRRAFVIRCPLPKIGLAPQSQYSPPSDMPPALVGLLTRARVGPAELIATIFDLANKGILEIVQTERRRWFGQQKDILIVKARDGERFSFEKLVTQAIASHDGKLFSEQKRRHPDLLQDFAKKVEQESIKEKIFAEKPSKSVQRLSTPALIIISSALTLGILLFSFLGQYAEMIFVPVVMSIPIAILAIILSYRLPKRTETGAMQTVQWKAFGKYLKKMVKDKQLSADNMGYWDSYFAYAVVFGLTKSWVKQFTELEAPTPVWFYTTGDAGGGIGHTMSSMPSLGSISATFSGMVDMVTGGFSGGSSGGSGGGGGGGGGGGAG